MKCFNGTIALCIAMLLGACNEAKEDVGQPLSEKDIYRTIGEEIPLETGMQWMNFHKNRSSASRLVVDGCSVSASTMNTMLTSTKNLVGVAFHYAVDESGTAHIVLVPVDESMDVWSSAPGRMLIDGNTGLEISLQQAKAWAERYKASYPSDIWYHFFGKDIFDQMQALPYFEAVDIEPATDPEDLSAEMLLIVWNGDVSSSGRTQAESGTVYDASNACPPCSTD